MTGIASAAHERTFPVFTDDIGMEKSILAFRALILGYYREHRREMPWRSTRDPYAIFVSEVMLQQTQVSRVLEKYPPFLVTFPTFESLAASSLRDVLAAWNGLGYNRRARNLFESARVVANDFAGELPDDPGILVRLPGIGQATAASIAAFAFGRPVAFIETNIRRLFIHFCFRGRDRVPDRQILPLVEATLDRSDPRTWYYALMDYGAMLKSRYPNPNRRSAHYTKQAPFEGSDRRVRGAIVRALTANSSLTTEALAEAAEDGEGRVREIAERLRGEGFLVRKRGRWSIA